jgi:hypothetical protein
MPGDAVLSSAAQKAQPSLPGSRSPGDPFDCLVVQDAPSVRAVNVGDPGVGVEVAGRVEEFSSVR